MVIRELTASTGAAFLEQLADLSADAVRSGAVLGWENPVERTELRSYWTNIFQALDQNNHFLFIAADGDRLLGTVQLERGHFPTSRHRGEVAKLIVNSVERRRGIGTQLMRALEAKCLEVSIELLVLDTRSGEPVEHLYQKTGYTRTGLIPNWMKFSTGVYRDTVFYYKQLAT